MLPELSYYARMAWGLFQFLRTPPLANPGEALRAQLEDREQRFLDLVRQAVFEQPGNPYREMFRLAGCRYQDLAEAVRREGLEAALAALKNEGVYLEHEELKCRRPIVRAGRHIPANETSFHNPLVTGFFENRSSGSRSRATRLRNSTEFLVYLGAHGDLVMREFGLVRKVYIGLSPILPSGHGIVRVATTARLGCRDQRWYTPGGTWRDTGHYRALTGFMILEARLMGLDVPFPAYLPPHDFAPVARLLAQLRANGRSSVVHGPLSSAVRVAAAARDKGYDIRGALFLTGGETVTEAKRAVIEGAGSEVFPRYAIGEFGLVGHACRQMRHGNCVHLYRDAVAVISHRRPAPLADVEVNSLLYTSLLPFAPLVLINAEVDDSGVIEKATCDCALTAAGFTVQIRDLASFGKLTGYGMTLVGTRMVDLLERALPARLGGAPGDYQLVESEGANQTQLTLRVSPRVGIESPEEVRQCFFDEVSKLHGGALFRRTWLHAGAVRVVIAEPLVTQSGKVLSLHLLPFSKGKAAP